MPAQILAAALLAALGPVMMLGVGLAMLRGRIACAGLLRAGDGRLAWTRVQLMLVSIAAAAMFLVEVLRHPGATAMPPLPQWFMILSGASAASYIGGKAAPAAIASLSEFLSTVRRNH